MFGVSVDGPADVLCDNKSVVINLGVPESVFSEKHNSICYHRVQEYQTSGTIQVGWIESEYNKAYIATKTTISTQRRHVLIKIIFNERSVIWEDDGT